jgi:L-rhamnose mutarotase
MQRYGSIIKIKPSRLEEYKKCHAAVWPGVLDMIKKCNIRNYSIYYKDGFLFSYYEYVGSDYEKDMGLMAKDPTTQKWWDYVKPFQQPLKTRKKNEWWASMDELFHVD